MFARDTHEIRPLATNPMQQQQQHHHRPHNDPHIAAPCDESVHGSANVAGRSLSADSPSNAPRSSMPYQAASSASTRSAGEDANLSSAALGTRALDDVRAGGGGAATAAPVERSATSAGAGDDDGVGSIRSSSSNSTSSRSSNSRSSGSNSGSIASTVCASRTDNSHHSTNIRSVERSTSGNDSSCGSIRTSASTHTGDCATAGAMLGHAAVMADAFGQRGDATTHADDAFGLPGAVCGTGSIALNDVVQRHLFDLTPIKQSPTKKTHYRQLRAQNPDFYSDDALVANRQFYQPTKLNEQQRHIFQYIKAHPEHIVLIQAGPGCGKSFTLKTIAYHHPLLAHVVIYKHDLLVEFRLTSITYTMALFAMKTFNLRYFQYKSVDQMLASNMSSMEFMMSVVGLMRRARLPDIRKAVVMIDEYTVVSKPLLTTLLLLCDMHGVGAVLCGDKDQLQNIHNSRHAICTSYMIGESFASKVFTLNTNERCSDPEYNRIINHLARYSSDDKLDDYAYAMVAALFMDQLVTHPIEYECVHLAGTHQELSDLAHLLVCRNGYRTEFYSLQHRTGEFTMPRCVQEYVAQIERQQQLQREYDARAADAVPPLAPPNFVAPKVGKFLPYLPLVVGGRYYVFKHREENVGTLQSINDDGTLTLELCNGETVNVIKTTVNMAEVIFEPHYEYLCDNAGDDEGPGVPDDADEGDSQPPSKRRARGKPAPTLPGAIYNYPIYPTNFMSIHKCQGCTISSRLDINLAHTNYQGLYVAFSRVRSPQQIAHISIPKQIMYIVAAIVNFPELCNVSEGDGAAATGDFSAPKISMDLLEQRMQNYILYEVVDVMAMANLCLQFNSERVSRERRCLIRAQIIAAVINNRQLVVRPRFTDASRSLDNGYNFTCLNAILKYKRLFQGVACIDNQYDRNVWLHEFILSNKELFITTSSTIKRHVDSTSQRQSAAADKAHELEIEHDLERLGDKASNCLTMLAQISGFEWGYKITTPSCRYIEKLSAREVRMSVTERAKFENVRIDTIAEGMYLEAPTPFCAKVYRRYKAFERGASGGDGGGAVAAAAAGAAAITLDWLVAALNEMLLEQRALRSQPPDTTTLTEEVLLAVAPDGGDNGARADLSIGVAEPPVEGPLEARRVTPTAITPSPSPSAAPPTTFPALLRRKYRSAPMAPVATPALHSTAVPVPTTSSLTPTPPPPLPSPSPSSSVPASVLSPSASASASSSSSSTSPSTPLSLLPPSTQPSTPH